MSQSRAFPWGPPSHSSSSARSRSLFSEAVAGGHVSPPSSRSRGVVCIGGLALDLSLPSVRVGVAWILLAALAWSAYIVVGQRASTTRDGVTNLALGCAWGSLFFAPFLGPGAMAATASWELIAIVVGVGLLSTAIPYTFEALAMRRLAAPTFALFAAILPATSALVGAVMLRQIPGVYELIGLVLVSIAVWLASRQ